MSAVICRFRASILIVVAIFPLVAACGSDSGGEDSATEFIAAAGDFECLRDLPRIRNMRVANKLGHLEEALALAENPVLGEEYPVGTILQLFPGEAMVKRGGDFDPDNNDWEYFELDFSAAGTSIRKRGRDDVINMFGGQCFGCHAAARDFDFICEKAHGCVELPVGDAVFTALQEGDPRCAVATP